MKKLIVIFLYCMISYNSSCKQETCDDYKKCETPESTTRVTAYLSNSDSVLSVGDTLRYYIRVPDTLEVTGGPNKYKKIFVKNLVDYQENNYIMFQTNSGDTVLQGSIHGLFFKGTSYSGTSPGLTHVAVKHGNGRYEVPRYLKYRTDTRDIECYFVFSRMGYYVIRSDGYLITFDGTDGKRWYLLCSIDFADAKTRMPIRPRYRQFLKHVDSSARASVQTRFNELDGTYWYYLEVKE